MKFETTILFNTFPPKLNGKTHLDDNSEHKIHALKPAVKANHRISIASVNELCHFTVKYIPEILRKSLLACPEASEYYLHNVFMFVED